MGILSNTVSICQFQVVGELPAGDLFEFASNGLSQQAFRSIESTLDELSTGWVTLDDHQLGDFSFPGAFWRDHYLTATLRRDQRKIPASLLKAYCRVAEEEFLVEHPGLHRVPKQKREEIKEAVRLRLLARTLPIPATYDMVWDTRSQTVTFASLSQSVTDLFEEEFKKAFPGLRLVLLHPVARAAKLIPEELAPSLEQSNRATSQAVLDQIRSNQWIGQDLLLWLLHRSMTGSGEYHANRPGTVPEGAAFNAYLDDRLVLMNATEEGAQKMTVAGPQGHFGEVRTALQNGKRITEATIHLEHEENSWKVTLKGERFYFASYRCPSVQLERDSTVDQASEREAVFFERMHLLETGLQLFDSLFADFLRERLANDWGVLEAGIQAWLERDE